MMRLFFVCCLLQARLIVWGQKPIPFLNMSVMANNKLVGINASYLYGFFPGHKPFIGLLIGAECSAQHISSPAILYPEKYPHFICSDFNSNRANLEIIAGFAIYPHPKILIGVNHNIYGIPFGYRLTGTIIDGDGNSIHSEADISKIYNGILYDYLEGINRSDYYIKYSYNSRWKISAGLIRCRYSYKLTMHHFTSDRIAALEELRYQYYLGTSYTF